MEENYVYFEGKCPCLKGQTLKKFRMGSVLDIRARHYIYYDENFSVNKGRTLNLFGREVSLLLWQKTTLIMKGSVPANRLQNFN